MNIFDALKARLEESGMFESQANEVMKLAMADQEVFSTMRGHWHDPASDYLPNLIDILFNKLRPIAYKWISENKPKAWYRVGFSPGIKGLQGKELEEYIVKYQREVQEMHKP